MKCNFCNILTLFNTKKIFLKFFSWRNSWSKWAPRKKMLWLRRWFWTNYASEIDKTCFYYFANNPGFLFWNVSYFIYVSYFIFFAKIKNAIMISYKDED